MRFITSTLVCVGLMFVGYTYGTNSKFREGVNKSAYSAKVLIKDGLNKILK